MLTRGWHSVVWLSARRGSGRSEPGHEINGVHLGGGILQRDDVLN